jgi:hypothetical protein
MSLFDLLLYGPFPPPTSLSAESSTLGTVKNGSSTNLAYAGRRAEARETVLSISISFISASVHSPLVSSNSFGRSVWTGGRTE